MTAPEATGHTTTDKRELNWLLDELVGRVASIRKAVILSGDGLATGASKDLAREDSEHLAAVAHKALASDRLSRGDLLPYECRVKRAIARELRKGALLRDVYKRFGDDDLNRLARLLAKPKPKAVIERLGDIDYPSRLVIPLLVAEPRLVGLFLKVLLRGEQPPERSRRATEARGHPSTHAGGGH